MSNRNLIKAQNAASGGNITNADYLDDRYAAMKPEYNQMLRMISIE
ncbi:MAG: hypothetical protein AAF614_07695 [Chloroflexota bacterium]